MKILTERIIGCAYLALFVTTALMANLGVAEARSPTLWTTLYGAGAALALLAARHPAGWWTPVVAGVLLGVAAAVQLDGTPYAGQAMLIATGLGVLGVLLRRPQSWWALLAGGALLSVSGAVLAAPGWEVPTLFAGLTATVAGIAVLRRDWRRPR